jgi:hypothetical protein
LIFNFFFFALLFTKFLVSRSNGHIVCSYGIKRSCFQVTILKSDHYHPLVHKIKHQISNNFKKYSNFIIFWTFYFKPILTLKFSSPEFKMSENFTFCSSFLCVFWVLVFHAHCIFFHKIFVWSTSVFALKILDCVILFISLMYLRMFCIIYIIFHLSFFIMHNTCLIKNSNEKLVIFLSSLYINCIPLYFLYIWSRFW